jgi:hypothetical protein
MKTKKKSNNAALAAEGGEEVEDYATLIYQDCQRRKREAACSSWFKHREEF